MKVNQQYFDWSIEEYSAVMFVANFTVPASTNNGENSLYFQWWWWWWWFSYKRNEDFYAAIVVVVVVHQWYISDKLNRFFFCSFGCFVCMVSISSFWFLTGGRFFFVRFTRKVFDFCCWTKQKKKIKEKWTKHLYFLFRRFQMNVQFFFFSISIYSEQISFLVHIHIVDMAWGSIFEFFFKL